MQMKIVGTQETIQMSVIVNYAHTNTSAVAMKERKNDRQRMD